MGDTGTFSYGRKPAGGAGLEFSAQRRSRFAQYTTGQNVSREQYNSVAKQAPLVAQSQPTTQQVPQTAQPQMPPAQPVYQQKYAPNEVPHDKVLYPQLSPIDTVEVPVLPEDNITNEIAFDVGDTLDENDEFFADMPKSSIKRPGVDLKQETKAKRKKKAKRTLGVTGLLAGVAILVVSWSLIQRYAPAVSASMRKKAGYPVYQLQPSSTFAVDRKSVEFNENNSLVYKVLDTSNNSKFIFSQQQVPEVVKNDESYQQFLNQTDKYASFDTSLGKAYLTKPQGIGSDVSVVLKSDKTLLFIRGPGDTSEQTWAQLVGSLKLE